MRLKVLLGKWRAFRLGLNMLTARRVVNGIYRSPVPSSRYYWYWRWYSCHALVVCRCRHSPAPHDDVIKWKHVARYWPFVRGIHRSQVNSPHKGQWRGATLVSLICAWIHDWVNNGEVCDLRRHRAHYDITVMTILLTLIFLPRLPSTNCLAMSSQPSPLSASGMSPSDSQSRWQELA